MRHAVRLLALALVPAVSLAFTGPHRSAASGYLVHRRTIHRGTPRAASASVAPASPRRRWRGVLPGRDALDREILGTALPSIANLAVVPLVGAVDTFWIGRMGDALALAGQGAANQCFFSVYFLIAFIPTITAPLVAKAAGGGDVGEARARVGEALFLANALGALGTAMLVLRPAWVLGLVLPAGAPAAASAAAYLRLRSLSLVPALLASVGFAAFRGMLDTVTPLKVSLASNALNLVLDPLLIFGARLGVAGAALATAASELGAGALYARLLVRRKLLELAALLRPPALASLLPLLRGGAVMLLRQLALNVGFVSATRLTQAMDATGVSAAAYAITNQLYSLGLVVMLAIQASGATLVPSALARGGADGVDAARDVGDRLYGWSTAIAAALALFQLATIPYAARVMSTLPEVQRAVRRPALVAALVQLSNGPLFAGEGIIMGLGHFGFLAALTSAGIAVMCAGLLASARLGLGVASVWWSLLGFHFVQLSGLLYHHLRRSPLARRAVTDPTPPAAVECVQVLAPQPEVTGEVCVVTPESEATPAEAAPP